jgi:hypothetical protein
LNFNIKMTILIFLSPQLSTLEALLLYSGLLSPQGKLSGVACSERKPLLQ